MKRAALLLVLLLLAAGPLLAADDCAPPLLGEEAEPLERFKSALELGKDFIEKGLLITGDNERPWLESTEALEGAAKTFGDYAEKIEFAMEPFEIAKKALRLKLAIDCATEGRDALLRSRDDASGALGMAIGLGEMAKMAADLLDKDELFAVKGPMMLLRRAGDDFKGIVAIRGICRNDPATCEATCRNDDFDGEWACQALRAGVPPPACITLQECFLDKDDEKEEEPKETGVAIHPTRAKLKSRFTGGRLSGAIDREVDLEMTQVYERLRTAEQAWSDLNVFQRHFGSQRRVVRDRLQTAVCDVQSAIARRAVTDITSNGYRDLIEDVNAVEPCPYKDRILQQVNLVLRTHSSF